MNEFNEKQKKKEKNLEKKKKFSSKLTIIMIVLWILTIIEFIDYYNSPVTVVAAGKPIIYIYPKTTQEVTIKLKNPEVLTCSYPKYDKEWSVLANPEGKLIDLKTNKELYSLYWEGTNAPNQKIKEGFCIKGEDSEAFLEEKLEILGLNYKEKEEFIVYWLPKLEANNYNLIRFRTSEEINEYMPLEITPTPDTIIRIMMEYKGINNYKKIPEQQLEKVERVGFTVVEWGGSELK